MMMMLMIKNVVEVMEETWFQFGDANRMDTGQWRPG